MDNTNRQIHLFDQVERTQGEYKHHSLQAIPAFERDQHHFLGQSSLLQHRPQPLQQFHLLYGDEQKPGYHAIETQRFDLQRSWLSQFRLRKVQARPLMDSFDQPMAIRHRQQQLHPQRQWLNKENYVFLQQRHHV